MGWLGDWGFRVPVWIDGTKVDAPLTNFTVCVPIPPEVTDYFGLLSNLRKVAVTTGDGETQCSAEMVLSRHPGLFVKVPAVAQGTDTLLYLYFDSEKTDNTVYIGFTGESAAASAWDDNTISVWHLEEVAGNALDSCLRNPATVSSTVTRGVPGMYGAGVNFKNTTDDWIKVQNPVGTSPQTLTVAAWVNAGTCVDYARVVNTLNNPSKTGYHLSVRADNKAMFGFYTSGGTYKSVTCTTVIENVGWRFLAGVWDGSALRIYVNGVQENTSSSATGIVHGTEPLGIGLGIGENYAPFNGIIDEVVLSNVPRSAAWLKAQYHSQMGTLVRTGPVEALPGRTYVRRATIPLLGRVLQTQNSYRAGIGSVSGTVSVLGTPAKRRVSLLDRKRLNVLAVTWSDPATGAYSFQGIDPDFDYLVVCDDHTQTYNAAAADWVKPEVSL